MKPEKHRSSIIQKILDRQTPGDRLRSNTRVTIEIGMIDMLTRAGYRPDKMWSEDEFKQLGILMDCAGEVAKNNIKSAKQYATKKSKELEKTVIEPLVSRLDAADISLVAMESVIKTRDEQLVGIREMLKEVVKHVSDDNMRVEINKFIQE